MRSSLFSRGAAAIAATLAVLVLGAGGAAASPAKRVVRADARAPARIGVHDARMVKGGARCGGASRRTKRARVGIRRRRRGCVVAASASSDPQPLFWGATIGSQLTGDQAPWDMGAVAKFEGLAGKPASLVQFFQPFADCGGATCSFYDFPADPMESIREHGSIPVLSWASQSIPSSLEQPDFQLSDVIEGRYDSYITAFAEEARNWGHPFFLRFDWEMNGNWFPWSEGVNGNLPGQYVEAWRHVHDLFAAAGAGNVTWVWCPSVEAGRASGRLSSVYPGDEYVDWTSLDGYNWGTNPAAPKGWKSFDQLFSSTYGEIADGLAPSKPMMIAEVGSSEYGGSKAAWIREMLADIPGQYPRVRAMLWFDKYDSGMDWPIETSPAAAAAFAAGVQSPVYVGNSYGGLPPGKIQPPS
jgi:hypothetical protein